MTDMLVKIGSIWYVVSLQKKMDGDRWALYYHEHFVRWLTPEEEAIMLAAYGLGQASMVP